MRARVGFTLSFFILVATACGRTDSELKQLELERKEVRASELNRVLLADLEENFPSSKGAVWAPATLSLDSDWLIQSPEGLWGVSEASLPTNLDCSLSDSRCDKDFLRLSCETSADCSEHTQCESMSATVFEPGQSPKNLCISHTDRLVNRVYDAMIAADRELDFVSLSLPTGRFRTAVVHALSYLSYKPDVPQIRMLFSGANAALPNILHSTDRALKAFVADVKVLSPNADRLPINLAWLSVGRLSWNHAKIIVADGDLAISGGHNLWDKDYLTANPVFDLSMEYRGEAAAASRDFVNEMWSHIDRGYATTSAANGRLEEFDEPWTTAGDVDAISLGRLGTLGANPSDHTLGSMIRLAKESVYIDQQDLFNQIITPLTRTFVFEDIIDAASRGISIKIIQSNHFPLVGGYGSVEGAKAYKSLIDALTSRIRLVQGLSATSARQAACKAVEYAPFRFSSRVNKWPYRNSTIGTHSKLLIVDEAAFYIGSHNLYPANLQEHGMVVTDAKVTQELLDHYWDKLWAESSPGRYSCPG